MTSLPAQGCRFTFPIVQGARAPKTARARGFAAPPVAPDHRLGKLQQDTTAKDSLRKACAYTLTPGKAYIGIAVDLILAVPCCTVLPPQGRVHTTKWQATGGPEGLFPLFLSPQHSYL
jgi:hypothetical protein